MKRPSTKKIDPLIAVDTGGTFTDFYFTDGVSVQTHKVLSTPQDPSKAILQGLKEMGFVYGEIIHGSTVATNALLEHKGARVALVTTAGFEDIIEIGRQNRQELYNIFTERARPLVKKNDRYGVRERMDAQGRVLQALNKAELEKLFKKIKRSRASSIAICLLNAYANDKHERAIAAALKKLERPLSLSSQICPEFREYERSSTTCANATLAPIMTKYLMRLSQSLNPPSPPFHKGGKQVIPLRVMQSNGGSLTVREASEESIRTLLSGPAGGVLGALRMGQESGTHKLLALDMGGTSTDLTLIDRDIELTSEAILGDYPIKTPMIRIHTIGAGGGSIARMDAGAALQVGPESAGARPGPICYGQGGQDCTITDAHLWLGRLHPRYFLGGTMSLHRKDVASPMQRLAKQMKITTDKAADGIIRVANANMARALRVISLERGYDPRQFTLLPFGGAGGLHACELADALEIPRVLIPRDPGILSAFGMAHADWTRDYVHTILLKDTSTADTRIAKEIEHFKRQAHRDAKRAGFAPQEIQHKPELDIRYEGQSYELRVPFTKQYRKNFIRSHRQQFGYSHKRPLEIVNVRLQARVKMRRPSSLMSSRAKRGDLMKSSDAMRLPRRSAPRNDKPKPLEQTKLYWGNKYWKLNLYERSQFNWKDKVTGPALVTEYSATTFVPPGWELECDKNGNLILKRT